MTEPMREPHANTDDEPDRRLIRLQSWITEDVLWRTHGDIAGMQDDVDPRYTMRKLLEEAIAAHCAALERTHHGGRPWPPADHLARGGVNARDRRAGDIALLQSDVARPLRRRCYGTVNGIKATIDRSYTLRTHLESALNQHLARLEAAHRRRWPPRRDLPRGRRP